MDRSTNDNHHFFANEREEREGIYTLVNTDGTIHKKVFLPDSSQTAIIRQAGYKEMAEIKRLTDDHTKQSFALIACCTMLEDVRAGLDDIENLSYQDFMRLVIACNNLNIE